MNISRRKFVQLLGLTGASAPLIVKASSLAPGLQRLDKETRVPIHLAPYDRSDYYETIDEQIISYSLSMNASLDSNLLGSIGREYMTLDLSMYLHPESRMTELNVGDRIDLNINHLREDAYHNMYWNMRKNVIVTSKQISAKVQEMGICDLTLEQIGDI